MSIAWFKRRDGEHGLFAYAFNEYDERRPWTILLHGRAFAHLGGTGRRHVTLSAEWKWFSTTCMLGFEVGAAYDHDMLVKIGIPGVLSLYLGGEHLLPIRWLPKESKTMDLRVFDKALWWNVWHDDMGWSSDTPRWRKGSWHPMDTVFGRMQYQEIPLSEERAVIPLPEGNYSCTVRLYESRWKRPRGWWVLRRPGAEVTPDIPVPFPGKGENSWDCGDDATFGMSCRARTVAEAVTSLAESVLNSRRRHGGPNWVPEKGWSVNRVEPQP